MIDDGSSSVSEMAEMRMRKKFENILYHGLGIIAEVQA